MKIVRVRCGKLWVETYYPGIQDVLLTSREHGAENFVSEEQADKCAGLIGGIVVAHKIVEIDEL